MKLDKLRNQVGKVETFVTDMVAILSPYCAPLPTAYLVGRATVEYLAWPVWVAFIAALVVESLGLASVATALELREYNQERRKSDPVAPFTLAAALVGIYLVVAVGLTVALDIAPVLAVYAPAIFPLLSLCGVTVLALRGDQRRRVGAIETVKAERKAKRQTTRKAAVVGLSESASNNGKSYANLDTLQAARMSKRDARIDALLTFYLDNPEAGPSDAARAVGVSRQTIYSYQSELEEAGKLKANGAGWEVV